MSEHPGPGHAQALGSGTRAGHNESNAFPWALLESEPWMRDAACARVADPEAWFPEKGGSVDDAKAICASCDVKAQCLEYALSNDERHGVWGGLSVLERRRVRAGLPVTYTHPVRPGGYVRWSPADDRVLREMFAAGATDREIAIRLRRRVSTVTSHRKVSLGLTRSVSFRTGGASLDVPEVTP